MTHTLTLDQHGLALIIETHCRMHGHAVVGKIVFHTEEIRGPGDQPTGAYAIMAHVPLDVPNTLKGGASATPSAEI